MTDPAKRDAMLAKIKKLLALGRDGSNENESATAMRQASKLMAEYSISEAEADMTTHGLLIRDSGRMPARSVAACR
jgi:hypothetical protein